MNWTAKDLDTYLQQVEYIDTLLVPLVKVETDLAKMKSAASSSDFLMHLTMFVESQFKGRMVLVPPFSYTPSVDMEQMGKAWGDDLSQMPFKHIFFLTTDPAWTSIELKGQVIWLPAIPLESMDAQLKQSILEDQFRQLVPKFTAAWSGQ
ncbi:DUF2487 family protein [Sporosarcina sp. 179-K 3D1 HS]|uniref:DUF2487 family protein n=1 Tax=Sporosarcina sp. 179-K 3D1 HS TaxID=3232169 RepID=UPI0039A1ABEE